MGKTVKEYLKEQLKTQYKKDAENCLIIFNKLKEIDKGHVWTSKWRLLVNPIYKGWPSDERRYKPTEIGYIFIEGIKNKLK